MDVTQYIFKSPSPSRVQVGRPDPSVDAQAKTQEVSSQIAKLEQSNVQNPVQTQEVEAVSNDDSTLIDVYT